MIMMMIMVMKMMMMMMMMMLMIMIMRMMIFSFLCSGVPDKLEAEIMEKIHPPHLGLERQGEILLKIRQNNRRFELKNLEK